MKKSTVFTIKIGIFGVAALNALMYLYFTYVDDTRYTTPIGPKMFFSGIVSALWLWFFLTHRAPNGDLDPNSMMGPRMRALFKKIGLIK